GGGGGAGGISIGIFADLKGFSLQPTYENSNTIYTTNGKAGIGGQGGLGLLSGTEGEKGDDGLVDDVLYN
ncbi:MAG: hypothetical protein DRP60_00740, partial [Spirochaetes bacterium]